MKRKFGYFFMAFMALAPVLYAQTAIYSGASTGYQASTLPLRNLQIEVRQVQREEAARAAITSGGMARDKTRANAATAHQQVLVLNGQRASIALRNTTSLRLVQTFVHNGALVVVPGTVLMEAGTGFEATPRWDGQDQVELELAAAQGRGTYHGQTASTTTLLVLPLGEWVTVAETAHETSGTRAGLSGTDNWNTQTGTEVQIRVNVR